MKALKTLSSRWEDIGMTIDIKDLDEIKKNYRGTGVINMHSSVTLNTVMYLKVKN